MPKATLPGVCCAHAQLVIEMVYAFHSGYLGAKPVFFLWTLHLPLEDHLAIIDLDMDTFIIHWLSQVFTYCRPYSGCQVTVYRRDRLIPRYFCRPSGGIYRRRRRGERA